MCSHPNVCHACDMILSVGETKQQHNRERHGGPRWGKPHIPAWAYKVWFGDSK